MDGAEGGLSLFYWLGVCVKESKTLELGARVLSRHGKATPRLRGESHLFSAHPPPQQELLLGAVNSVIFVFP